MTVNLTATRLAIQGYVDWHKAQSAYPSTAIAIPLTLEEWEALLKSSAPEVEPIEYCKTAEFGCECGLPDTEPCPLPPRPSVNDRHPICAKDGCELLIPRRQKYEEAGYLLMNEYGFLSCHVPNHKTRLKVGQTPIYMRSEPQ